jgi:hypothetical protein
MFNATSQKSHEDKEKISSTNCNIDLPIVPPLSCQHHENISEVECVSLRDGQKEIIAQIFNTSQINAKDAAECFAQSVNRGEQLKKIVGEMLGVFEICLDSGCLPWSLEQDVEDMAIKVRQVI